MPYIAVKNLTYEEMFMVWRELNTAGLKTVICQTEFVHIGPGEKNSPP